MNWQLQETRALQVEFSSILPTDGYRLSLFGRGPIALHGLVHFLNTIGPSLTKVIYAYFDRISYIVETSGNLLAVSGQRLKIYLPVNQQRYGDPSL